MTNIVFKYQPEIDALIDKGAKLPLLSNPQNKYAYRFVSSTENSKNHKPVYIQNPQRAISNIDKNKLDTSGYALSCFEQEDKAIQKFNELRTNMRNIALTMGNALCSGTLNEKDGLITNSNHETHFDLYEYHGCDLSITFKIIKILV